ncbi:MAG: hypothetical protein IJQ74_02825, partial [Synergistaceae bacterium]|nr:hypothetical protein [Synergistaceae bacterium]
MHAAGKYFLHLIWPSSCEVCGRIGSNPCEACGRIMREREIIASNARGFYRIFTDEIITRHFDNLTVYSAL